MTITICTGFHPAGLEEYGHRFLETFDRHWPKSVDLVVYTEEPTELPRGENRLIWDIPGCQKFIDRNKTNAVACGEVPQRCWRPKEIERGYSFRTDAVKFCRMAFIPLDMARTIHNGIFVWLDGDVVTFKDVPEGFVEGLIGDAPLAYLGRRNVHSETGFIAFSMPFAWPVIFEYARLFASDEIFRLEEWHSAYAFDHARNLVGLPSRNLTPGGYGHVWFQSPLGQYTDHTKGPRKKLGYSPERPDA